MLWYKDDQPWNRQIDIASFLVLILVSGRPTNTLNKADLGAEYRLDLFSQKTPYISPSRAMWCLLWNLGRKSTTFIRATHCIISTRWLCTCFFLGLRDETTRPTVQFWHPTFAIHSTTYRGTLRLRTSYMNCVDLAAILELIRWYPIVLFK